MNRYIYICIYIYIEIFHYVMSKYGLRNEHSDNMSNRSVALGLRATLPPSWPCGWLGVTAVRLGIVIDSEPVNSLDEGKGQGTMLVCVLEPVSTDTHGHWFKGQYVVASDSHLRWWFKDGDGQTLASRYRYHYCCDGNGLPGVEEAQGDPLRALPGHRWQGACSKGSWLGVRALMCKDVERLPQGEGLGGRQGSEGRTVTLALVR